MKIRLVLLVAAVVIPLIWLLSKTAAVTIEPVPPKEPQSISRSAPTSTKDIEQLIKETAILYGIDETRFLATAKCESSLRPNVVGDGGESVGLFQIHLVSHPTVTKEQALDPIWATEWSAAKFKENPKIWTCYRNLYL